MKILITAARPRSLINFRGKLLESIKIKGHCVTAAASYNDKKIIESLEKLNIDYESYGVNRTGLNPFADLGTLRRLRMIIKRISPDIILAYTIKPVIFCGILCKFNPNIQFYPLITGLGYTFQGTTFKRKILKKISMTLYRLALSKAKKVIFQNPDNLEYFVNKKITTKSKCCLVNGSGVDLNYFTYHNPPLKDQDDKIVFLLIARLLKDKGIREYVEAAKAVKQIYPESIFQLIGKEDSSPDKVSLDDIHKWHKKDYINYLGSFEDVRPYLKGCNVYVLPSYHEGTPRTVLEAMATGKPILTTDVPGCRETVIHGSNGFLVSKQSSQELAEKMIWFIENRSKCKQMGDKSRKIAEEKYDVYKVNEQILKIINL